MSCCCQNCSWTKGVLYGAAFILIAGSILGITFNSINHSGIPMVPPPMKPAAGIDFKSTFLAYQDKSAVFIDARADEEYREGHIQGAISVPFAERQTHLADLRNSIPRDKHIIVYCDGQECEQSKHLSAYLARQGWTKLNVFMDGFPAWRDAALPMSQGDKP